MTVPDAIFALDPALNSPGVAALLFGQVVAAAALPQPQHLAHLPLGERARHVAANCVSWWHLTLSLQAARCPVPRPVFIFELPQVYGGPQTNDANDLVALALVCGAATQLISQGNGYSDVLNPTPREWTKGSKKTKTGDPWASQRGKMIARRLSPAEREVVPPKHDAIDAVGLGLFAAGRLEGVRVNARPRADAAGA